MKKGKMRISGKLKKWLLLAVMLIAGIAIGVLSALMAGHAGLTMMEMVLVLAVAIYPGFILQIIVHEFGHLVGGLLSGYRFSSFRIGSLMLIRTDAGFRVRRFSLAGTGGQCLMTPPDMKDGSMPVTLYNISGPLANILCAAAFLALYFALMNWLGVMFGAMALIALFLGLTNGIPMSTGMLDNDGKNAVSMRKDKEAQYALWLQLKVNEQNVNGVRTKDMPAEWFRCPTDAQMKNPMIAAVGVLCCARFMDEMNFEEADRLMRHYCVMKSGMAGLHRAALICDRIYIELTGLNRPVVVDRLLTDDQKKIMKAMRTQPSVLRTEYALKLIHENDEKGATDVLAAFDKLARRYPYPQEIAAERELIAHADKMHRQQLSSEENV